CLAGRSRRPALGSADKQGGSGVTRIAIAALAAGLLVAGNAAYANDAPYKIGWITSLSGPAAGTSGAANMAVQLAVDLANASNAAGRKIVLITGDDASDPKTAAQVCARFVLEDKVDAIVGAQPTPSRLACNQAAAKAGLPYIAASGSAGDICLPNMFYVGQVPNQFVLPLADYLVKQGWKRVYLIGADYSRPRARQDADRGRRRHRGGNELHAAKHFGLFGRDRQDRGGETRCRVGKPDRRRHRHVSPPVRQRSTRQRHQAGRQFPFGIDGAHAGQGRRRRDCRRVVLRFDRFARQQRFQGGDARQVRRQDSARLLGGPCDERRRPAGSGGEAVRRRSQSGDRRAGACALRRRRRTADDRRQLSRRDHLYRTGGRRRKDYGAGAQRRSAARTSLPETLIRA